MKRDTHKESLLEQLKKTPVIHVACEKSGIGRATYYRWRKEDTEFAGVCDEAIQEGSSLINDMAESQLISAIKDKNLGAIIFWLKNHHPQYATRVEVTAKLHNQDPLTPEQEELIKQALSLAALNKEDVNNNLINKKNV